MTLKLSLWLAFLGLSPMLYGQVIAPEPGHPVAQYVAVDPQVPLVISFSGTLSDLDGALITGLTNITFSIYSEEFGGTPLWVETQNVTLDSQGHFNVSLGSSEPTGIPIAQFVSREAHWVGMSINRGVERPRVLLASVPYSLESANAETLGGRRPEEFVLASQLPIQNVVQDQSSAQGTVAQSVGPVYPVCPRCGFTTPPAFRQPAFEATNVVGPSFLSDATSGPPFQVKSSAMVTGLNVDMLHGLKDSDFAQLSAVNHYSEPQVFTYGMSLDGNGSVGTPGIATGSSSPTLDFIAKDYNSATATLQNSTFRLQADPADSTQQTPDRLALLFGSGTNLPIHTGFSLNSDGTLNFAANQGFPASAFQAALNSVSPETNSLAYQWTQTVTSSAIVVGANTITLPKCPPGVNASDPTLYVYISGTGTPEAVKVTGGTCTGNGQSGTLQFVAAYVHPAGYVISSATSGIQEALIASNGATQSANIVVPAGEYPAYAPITIAMTHVSVDFSGVTIDCYAQASCIYIGNPANPNAAQSVTLKNPQGKPMVPNGTYPFIEDNGQVTTLENVTAKAPTKPNSFGSYVQVDNDQDFMLNGINSNIGYGVRCDQTFCGSYLTAPGPFATWAAVGTVINPNLAMQCSANGIDWQSGNGLTIIGGVIEGWAEFGVRTGHKRGGFGGTLSTNVYYEPGNCAPDNPLGNVGLAGIIDQGGPLNVSGTPANGPSGIFPNWGSAFGSQEWLYWIAPVSATYGDGVPLPAGYAYTEGVTPITGTFPVVPGASSYRILKIATNGTGTPPYPEGTGNYLLMTLPQSSCASQTCQFIDSGQTLTTYSNNGENQTANIYVPLLTFWPGSIVISWNQDTSTATTDVLAPLLTADTLGEGALVSVLPENIITGQAQTMIPTATSVPAAANISAANTSGNTGLPGGTIFKAFLSAFSPSSGYKGRVNFGDQGMAGGYSPIITLGDSNFGRTWASGTQRPTADIGDLDIGYEGSLNTYYQRAATEIRQYIGKFPDGNPQESLTATTKTFNLPVAVNGSLTVNGVCIAGCNGSAQPGSLRDESASHPKSPEPSSLASDPAAKEHAESFSASRVGVAAEIPTTPFCTETTCASGHYALNYYLDSSSSCPTPGPASVAITITWKDEIGTKSLKVPLTGSGVSDSNLLSLGSTSSFGSGEISLWSAGDAPISYSTAYVGCSSGTGAYSLHVTLRHLQ